MAVRFRFAVLVATLNLIGGSIAAHTPSAETASAFVAATRRSVLAFTSPAQARAAGYVLNSSVAGVQHWVNPQRLSGGKRVDPRRPSGLVYLDTTPVPTLVAAFFLLSDPAASPPALGGAGWHRHGYCFGPGGLGISAPGHGCPPGTDVRTTAAMLHVWLSPRAGDPFARVGPANLFCPLAAP